MKLSHHLFKKAETLIPGGVNSPVRAFRGVGGDPVFFKQGIGSTLIDVDDNNYLDYVGSWGPMILGHASPAVIRAVQATVSSGLSFGAPTALEVDLAERIIEMMPSIETIRMVNSGTEATMTAIRLARGVTKRDKFIKFRGCYHGHSDSLLVEAGSGLLTLGIPATPGVPASIAANTLVTEFNDLEAVERLFAHYGDDISAVIVEPIAGNMGFVMPKPGFLEGLRTCCDEYGAFLIFDEVMTGFRVASGGAQAHFGITPDLTTLGKIIGGGMPVGAIGGRRDIMAHLAPEGSIYQAGTLSGNPIAMAAGLATLNELQTPNFYMALHEKTSTLVSGLLNAARLADIPFSADSLGGMFGFSFSKTPIQTLSDAQAADESLFRRFYHEMLKKGIYFAPSMYEAGFVSSAHTLEEIEKTILIAADVFANLSTKQ